ncbi:MAG: threonine/serine dehydratase [Candidatus Aminicenantes bacterium]|jgi:threonine dehydratase
MNKKDNSDFCKKELQDNDEKDSSIHDEEEPAQPEEKEPLEKEPEDEEIEEEEEKEEWEEEEEEEDEEKRLDYDDSAEGQKQEIAEGEKERVVEKEEEREQEQKSEEPILTAPETVKVVHEQAQEPTEQEEELAEHGQEQKEEAQIEREEDKDRQVKEDVEKEKEKDEELSIVHEQEVEDVKKADVTERDVEERDVKEKKVEKIEARIEERAEEPGPLENIDLKKEVERAEKTIRKYIRETPAEHSPFFSQEGNCEVYLKLENLQLTGSFKLRGTMNKLLSLSKKEKKTILITASSGNHGAAFAHGVKKLGLRGIIYLPGHSSQAKVDALKYYDVVLKFYGTDCVKTEEHAIKEAVKNSFKYIPPYNDLKIIGGQGTIGIELKRQVEKIDAVLVPVGGGGLISGIAGYLKSLDESIEIIGCQPRNSAVMYESIKAGKILEMESQPTLSDGSAGGIEQGAITFDICKKYVDDFILVSEEEIKEAMKLILEKHFMLIEGAGALSVASFLKSKERFKGKNVVLIISGSKLTLDTLREVISSEG